MGRLLEEAFGADVAAAFRAGEPGPGGWHPGADVQETDDSYVVEIDLPGVRRDDVSVEFGHGELAVTGEVKERERVGLLRHRTRRTGRFDYRIDLPGEVLDDRISASLEDGVLTVRVPKTERARRRRIAIGGGGSTGE
jgi:HSP20 family protein